MNALQGLLNENMGALVCFWTVMCVWLGFRMGRQVVVPGAEKPAVFPTSNTRNVDIDRTKEDPWEEALSVTEPGARITGDLQ